MYGRTRAYAAATVEQLAAYRCCPTLLLPGTFASTEVYHDDDELVEVCQLLRITASPSRDHFEWWRWCRRRAAAASQRRAATARLAAAFASAAYLLQFQCIAARR